MPHRKSLVMLSMALTQLQQLISTPDLAFAEQVALLETISAMSSSGEVLAACVQLIRQHGMAVPGLPEAATDIVGTGADGSNSFNVSTTAAFVIAGADIPVAKHGNRSVSSLSGSFDCLQALQVQVPETPAAVLQQLQKQGISFLFAPFFYPGMARLAPVRKALAARGKKNIFQLLGPLLHPGRVRYQVLGVYDANLMRPMAEAMQILGIRQGAVVHSSGMDELSLLGNNQILLVNQAGIRPFKLEIADYGFSACQACDLNGGGPSENGHILEQILQGNLPGPKTDTVIINAALALYLHHDNFADCLQSAQAAIQSGAALDKLNLLRKQHGFS